MKTIFYYNRPNNFRIIFDGIFSNKIYSWITLSKKTRMERPSVSKCTDFTIKARKDFDTFFNNYLSVENDFFPNEYLKKILFRKYFDYYTFRKCINHISKKKDYQIKKDDFLFSSIYHNSFPKNSNIFPLYLLITLSKFVKKVILDLLKSLFTFEKIEIKNVLFLRKKSYDDLGIFSQLKKFIKQQNVKIFGLIFLFSRKDKFKDFLYFNKIKKVEIAIFRSFLKSSAEFIKLYRHNVINFLPEKHLYKLLVDMYNAKIIVSFNSKIITGVLLDEPVYCLLKKYKNENQIIASLNESFWFPPFASFDYNNLDIYYCMNHLDKMTINCNGGNISKYIPVPFYRKNLIIPSNGISKKLNEKINDFEKIALLTLVQVPQDQYIHWSKIELNNFLFKCKNLIIRNPNHLFIVKGKKGELSFVDEKIKLFLEKAPNVFIIASKKPRRLKFNQFEDLILKSNLLISMAHLSTTIWQSISWNVPAIAINDMHQNTFMRNFNNFEVKLNELQEAYDYWINIDNTEWERFKKEISKEVNLGNCEGLEYVAKDICNRVLI